MTIEHKGERVSENVTIPAISTKVAILFTLLTATSLRLKPDPKGNHEQDQVTINFCFGPSTLTGHEINDDPICKINEVSWKQE